MSHAAASQPLRQPYAHAVGLSQAALPYRYDVPAFLPQAPRRSAVSALVYLYLRHPEGHIRLGKFRSRAIPVAVPEATVDEYGDLPGANSKVRLAG
jgi:hypothetical protein